MKYSIVSTLKPFRTEGHLDWHQQTALFSWSLVPDLEVCIIGADDEQGRSLVQKYNFTEVSHVLRAYDVGYFSQAPIIPVLIKKALQATTGEWVAMINSDITILPEFTTQLDRVLGNISLTEYPKPFITVRRRDFTIQKPLTTEAEIRALDSAEARLHKVTGSDIFLTTRAFWEEIAEVMPPFIYGRFSWDVYFHRLAVLESSLPIDASDTVICYHPYHGSLVDKTNPEIFHNLMMYEALFADHVLDLSHPRWVKM